MRRKVTMGSAVFLLIAAVVTLGLVIREYRRERDAIQLLYTHFVKKRDIVDAARNAFSALSDAEIREQNYVLTGETVYSEAYADDLRTWQDEFASLELVAKNDPATTLVKDLSKAGTRTLNELTLVLSVYEKSGREAALDRIRKSTGIVYLDQARRSLADIEQVDRSGVPEVSQITSGSLSALRRIVAAAALLFVLAGIGMTLLLSEIRQKAQAHYTTIVELKN